jgi:hypothetical protein
MVEFVQVICKHHTPIFFGSPAKSLHFPQQKPQIQERQLSWFPQGSTHQHPRQQLSSLAFPHICLLALTCSVAPTCLPAVLSPRRYRAERWLLYPPPMTGGCWEDDIGRYGCTSCPTEQGGVGEGRGKDHDGPTTTTALTTLLSRTSPWPAETSTARPDVSGGTGAVAGVRHGEEADTSRARERETIGV